MEKKKLKIIYLISIITMFLCSNLFAKSIDLNGIKVSLATEIVKRTEGDGSSINDEKFSTAEYEIEEREEEDRYVEVELIIINNNNYESANITIEEVPPMGFRQSASNKNERIISTKIESKSEIKYKYKYRYHRSFLKDQYNSILYDENGDIIDNNKEVSIDSNYRKGNTNTDSKKSINNKTIKNADIEEEAADLRKGIGKVILFLLAFVMCVILLIVFMMFYKTIKGDDVFFNNEDSFKCLAALLSISLLVSIIMNDKGLAKSAYVPQIYEYGKSYEKVIYESVSFNDGIYRFAYKISFMFDSLIEITDADYENDTDGDGLVDALEYQYMTDKNNVDTDNDGISDYFEVMYLDYNPLSDDTFNDGIKDGDRDYDTDKLTNIEEINYGTDLYNIDTDYDTLTDYDEINIYNTNPLSIDTDEDLLSDPDELKLGLDPTNPMTDGVTLDAERKIEQTYDITNVPEELRSGYVFISGISGSVSGNIDDAITVRPYINANLENAKGIVGTLFKIDVKDDYSIKILLDAKKVSDRAKYLTVCNYEDNVLIPMPTVCNDNDELSSEITSGVYCLVDSDLILRELNIFNKKYY